MQRVYDIETDYYDPDSYYYWKKASEWTSEELKEEKIDRQMNPEAYEEMNHKRRTLEESHALYKDPESIKQISEVAKKLGFGFRLEKSSKTEEEEHKGEAMLGIFTRKN